MREMQPRDRRNNQVQIPRESFRRGRNNNIPESHPSVLGTLKVERPRHFVAVESTYLDSWDLLVIDDGLTILHNGDGSPDHDNIKALPFSRPARQLRRGGRSEEHTSEL